MKIPLDMAFELQSVLLYVEIPPINKHTPHYELPPIFEISITPPPPTPFSWLF